MPELYEALPKSEKIIPLHFAVTDSNDPVTFYVADNIEAGSITVKQGHPVQVQGTTLRSLLDSLNLYGQIDLMKVDIEGAEIQLFNSSTDELLRRFSQITVEFHDFLPEYKIGEDVKRIKSRMENIGFYCIVFSGRSNFDVLFVRKGQKEFSYTKYLWYKYIYKYSKGIQRVVNRRFLS